MKIKVIRILIFILLTNIIIFHIIEIFLEEKCFVQYDSKLYELDVKELLDEDAFK